MFNQIKFFFEKNLFMTVKRNGYNSYDFSSIKVNDKFTEHILENRLKVFLNLMLIDNFTDEYNFLFGISDLRFEIYELSDDPDVYEEILVSKKEMGISVEKEALNKNDAFLRVLGTLSFRQIISKYFPLNESNLILETGESLADKFKEFRASITSEDSNNKDSSNIVTWKYDKTFFLVYNDSVLDLIVFRNELFSRKNSKIDLFLSDNFADILFDFSKFIKKYSINAKIPHEVYIDKLIKLFPGKINIRTIS